MTRLTWDNISDRIYETGIKNGVIYVVDNLGNYTKGVAWNGLTSVKQKSSGGEPNAIYSDNVKYLNLLSKEEFSGTIEAYSKPKEFLKCLGEQSAVPGLNIRQQRRSSFGFCYKTLLGNDTNNLNYGYKLHLVYGCYASPSEAGYNSVSDNLDPIIFSWEIISVPVNGLDFNPTSIIEIDSTRVAPLALLMLEDILYGAIADATLPSPSDVIAIIENGGYGWVVGSSLVGIGRIN